MTQREDASKYIQRKRKKAFNSVMLPSQNQFVVTLKKKNVGIRLCLTNFCQRCMEFERED